MGTLAVRQFERQTNRDVTIVVDLWQPEEPGPRDLAFVEVAVSFAATAVTDLCVRGPSQIQLALAGDESVVRRGKASSAYQQELTDCLAGISASHENNLEAVVDGALEHMGSDAFLIVITTRDIRLDELAGHHRQGGESSRVIRINRGEHELYFLWDRG